MLRPAKTHRTTLLESFAICAIILGVAVVIYAVGNNSGVEDGRSAAFSLEQQQALKERAMNACADTEPNTLRRCLIEASEATQRQSESRLNLLLQQDMSRWAFWMMIVSSLTLCVTGLGIVWVRDTLIETRRAVESADHAVNVTRKIGVAQVRAYLSEVEVLIGDDLDETGCFRGKVVVRNAGQSPGRNVHIEFVLQYAGNPQQAQLRANDVKLPPVLVQPAASTGDLAAGAQTEVRVKTPNMKDINGAEQIRLGRAVLFARGWIKYTDVFDEIHTTHFCWHRDRDTVESGFAVVCSPFGNSAD